MRRTLLGLAAAATALVLVTNQPALAQSVFPGAGYGMKDLTGMTVKFTVPRVPCSRGENSLVMIGVISPAIGTSDGWNAAAVVGCANGTAYSRIQVWVSAVGGGYKMAEARPGDRVRVRLVNGSTSRASIDATNLTRPQTIRYRLTKPTTVAAAGSYAGAFVPNFDHVNLNVWANHKPIGEMPRARRVAYRGKIKIMEPSGVWKNQNFTVHFRHR